MGVVSEKMGSILEFLSETVKDIEIRPYAKVIQDKGR